jgi:cobalt-zinc-cadmium efflux system outer membrane protein
MNKAQKAKLAQGTRIALTILLAIFVTACTPPNRGGTNKGWAPPRSLGKAIPSYQPVEKAAQAPAAQPSAEELTGALTLRDALTHAFLKNPELAAFSWEVRATDARILQAGLFPNPELGAEVENFGGSDTQQNFDGAETTFALSQLIELGGKREKRSRIAKFERDLAGWDYEAKRLDVYVATAKAFMATLAAQRRHELKQDQFKLAGQVRDTVRERVQAGRASALEDTKADVQLANAEIAADRARGELQAARERLSTIWGSTTPIFKSVEGQFDSFQDLPPLANLLRLVPDNPDAARLRAEMQLKRSTFDLEKARDIPDLTVSAGVRRFEETGDSAFVTGISVPIPVFGMNPGGVLEAERRIFKAHHQGRGAIVTITSSLKQAYREGAALHASLSTISAKVLPGARRAYEAAQQGYRQGKFDFLDVLDAQRTLFEAHERYLETAAAYHQTTLDIERLTGRSIVAGMSENDNRRPEKNR